MVNSDQRVSTVLAADVVGYNRLMHFDEERAQTKLEELRSLFAGVVSEFNGTVSSDAGWSLLADFTSAVDALSCAIELQHRVRNENADVEQDQQLQLCCGLDYGKVTIGEDTLFGDGLTVATRLRSLAEPGGVVVSASVVDEVGEKVDARFVHRGEQSVENIADPVQSYAVIAADDRRTINQFFSELTRRRIIRTAGAYVVFAWLIVQVADVILSAFEAPAVAMQGLVTLLIVGFPLAVVLTWSYNWGADGVVLTPDSGYSRRAGRWLRFLVVGGAAGLSAVVLWLVWDGYLAPVERPSAARNAERIEQPVIAVLPFEMTLGSEEIEWLGEGVANLVRHSLADSRQTIVFSDAASQSLGANARESGIDYLVRGNYLTKPDGGVTMLAEIEHTATGAIEADEISADNAEELLSQVDDLTRRIYRRLGLPYATQVGQYSADFASDNIAAYELFVGGLTYLQGFDYEQAATSFRAALEQAPNFAMAKYRLAQTLEATGSNREAYELLQQIDSTTLDERERLYVEGALRKYLHNRDIDQAIAVYEELVREYPFDSEAHQNLAESFWVAFDDQRAIEQLKQLVDIHPREASSWMALAEQQVETDDSEGARASLQKYSALRPDDAYADALGGNLAFAQGALDLAREHYSSALTKHPGMGIAELNLARTEYFDGNEEEAFARWKAIRTGSSVETDYRIDAAFDEAGALQGAERFAESIDVLRSVWDEISNEGFRESVALTVIAASEIERGQYPAARELLNEAIGKRPHSVQPTRQLFFLGVLELRANDRPAFNDALQTLSALPLDAGEREDRTRNAAVACLQGLALLEQSPADAARLLREASSIDGYNYRLYKAFLVDALRRDDQIEAARKLLAEIKEPDLANPRFDLELDRARANALLSH